jgi:hypothetical protein
VDRGQQLSTLAQFERRAIFLYRAFARQFAREPALSSLWREMSDVEAAHFAILTLAAESVERAPPVGASGGTIDPRALEEPDRLLAEAEARAKAGSLSPGEAVEVACAIERGEIPRIGDLLAWLPPRALAPVRETVVGSLEGHLACLGRIAGLSRRGDLTAQIERLTLEARALGGS